MGIPLNLIVAGSRSIVDETKVFKIIDEHLKHLFHTNHLHDLKDLTIFSGGATGVDSIAWNYARTNQIALKEFPAQWVNERGLKDLSAGFKRNQAMGLQATHLLAIWDGRSRGTSHMIEFMDSLDKFVKIVYISENLY